MRNICTEDALRYMNQHKIKCVKETASLKGVEYIKIY